MPTVSVIVPTRNRAHLWRSAWLLDSLRAQTVPPDELVIALDHTEDDTLDVIRAATTLPFPIRILDVLEPRPGPNPASGIPDNCAIHAARGDIILHVDDDIALPPDYCHATREHFRGLPAAIIWGQLTFVDEARRPLPAHKGDDCRSWHANKHRWPLLPGGLYLLPRNIQLHWGAVWATTARVLRQAGGHELAYCRYHNTDTRLGNRLVRSGIASFVTADPKLTPLHLGTTWYAQHAQSRPDILASQGPRTGPRIANGGEAFWTSPWFESAYRETLTIDQAAMPATIRQRAALDRQARLAARKH